MILVDGNNGFLTFCVHGTYHPSVGFKEAYVRVNFTVCSVQYLISLSHCLLAFNAQSARQNKYIIKIKHLRGLIA